MFDDHPHGAKELIIEQFTERKSPFSGFLKGLFDDHPTGGVADETQVLAQYAAQGQVQGIVIGDFFVVQATVFRRGQIMNVLGVITKQIVFQAMAFFLPLNSCSWASWSELRWIPRSMPS